MMGSFGNTDDTRSNNIYNNKNCGRSYYCAASNNHDGKTLHI